MSYLNHQASTNMYHRKCGRVVCASCSQHRITIPHEFIVQPPQDTSTNRRPSLSQRDTEAASTTCGGTKVRLCNPCVPDPNTLPPPPIRSPDRERRPDRPTYLLSGYGQDQFRITEEALNEFEAMGNQPSSVSPRRSRTVSYSTPVVHRAAFPESRFPPRTTSQVCTFPLFLYVRCSCLLTYCISISATLHTLAHTSLHRMCNHSRTHSPTAPRHLTCRQTLPALPHNRGKPYIIAAS